MMVAGLDDDDDDDMDFKPAAGVQKQDLNRSVDLNSSTIYRADDGTSSQREDPTRHSVIMPQSREPEKRTP